MSSTLAVQGLSNPILLPILTLNLHLSTACLSSLQLETDSCHASVMNVALVADRSLLHCIKHTRQYHLSQMLLSALKVTGVATAEHDCWAA